MLDLKRPIYQQTAAYGHFGRIAKISLGSARIRQKRSRRYRLTPGTRHDEFRGAC